MKDGVIAYKIAAHAAKDHQETAREFHDETLPAEGALLDVWTALLLDEDHAGRAESRRSGGEIYRQA